MCEVRKFLKFRNVEILNFQNFVIYYFCVPSVPLPDFGVPSHGGVCLRMGLGTLDMTKVAITSADAKMWRCDAFFVHFWFSLADVCSFRQEISARVFAMRPWYFENEAISIIDRIEMTRHGSRHIS